MLSAHADALRSERLAGEDVRESFLLCVEGAARGTQSGRRRWPRSGVAAAAVAASCAALALCYVATVRGLSLDRGVAGGTAALRVVSLHNAEDGAGDDDDDKEAVPFRVLGRRGRPCRPIPGTQQLLRGCVS